MPRGFLVKRAGKSNGGYTSYRQRHNSSEEDRQSVNSDSGSEPEHLSTQYGSPDSGFSQSPINLTFKPHDSVPDTLRLADNIKPENRLNGATTDNLMLSNSFKREQLQIKFKLLDNYGFRCTSNSIRADPNEGVINYSKNKTSSTATSREASSHSTTANIDTENNVNIANTREITSTVSKSPTKPSETGSSHVASDVYGGRDDIRNHNINHPLGLLRTLDRHRDFTTSNQRDVLPPTSGVITSVNSRTYSEQLVNHLKQQQQQFRNGLLAAAAAAKVSVPTSSPPLPVVTGSAYPSPLYFSAFDRLTVSSPGKHSLSHHGDSTSAAASSTAPSSTSSGSARSSPAPSSPNKRRANGDCITPSKAKVIKKPKSARKIQFDEDKSSPVSGTIIRDWDEGEGPDNTKKVVCGDIDSSLNDVQATPEAIAELEKIENKIGDYICQLCKEYYDDAFQLAAHRCSRIVNIEYRCPECEKVFNCPANLASHRRWHKPRPNGSNAKSTATHTKTISSETMVPGMTVLDRKTPSPNSDVNEPQFECRECGKKFKRQAYLRKHQANHVNSAVQSRMAAPATDLTSAKAKHLLQPQLPSPTAPVMPIDIRPLEVYDCKYCPSSFNNSPGLTRHINKCHPSESRQVILLPMPVSPRTC